MIIVSGVVPAAGTAAALAGGQDSFSVNYELEE
jgi:hypothetical protein